jgi:tetratricopeptide (TPR) repeat protein
VHCGEEEIRDQRFRWMVFCAMHLPIEASATVFLAAWGWEIHSLRGKKAHERAQLAFAKKDFDGALKASKEAVTADPNDVSFLKSRAWGEILTCQFEECQRTIDEAMARAREEDDDVAADELTMIQAELYCCGHRFEETRPLLNRLYQSMLWAGYAYLLRAEIDIVEKDLGKALEALRKAEQHRLQAPGLAQKLRLEALVHLLKGDLDEAEDKINDATKASPESPAFATKALILWKQGKLSEALAAADKAIELTTYYAEACWIRSQLRTISGDSAGAAKDGARAAQLRYKPYLEHLFEVPKREETTTHA